MTTNLKNTLIGNGETDPDKIFKNWSESGLLFGITNKEHAHKLALILEDAAQKLLANEEYCSRMGMVLFPCIRRIYSCIAGISEDNSISRKYAKNSEMQEKALALFKVEDVLKELDAFAKYFMVFGDLYLKNLDHEAELTVLFCSNFEQGIYNQVKN